jgi:hypothetical protein
MSSKTESAPEYYIVPLGRERGSYLDLLNLPPDATPEEASKAEGEYRRQIKQDFKSKRKKLMTAHKGNGIDGNAEHTQETITKEELEAGIKQLEDEQTRRETELNEKQNKYDARQAAQRRLSNEGRKDDDGVVWLEMYRSLGKTRADVWRFLLSRRAIGNVDPELLTEIEHRWINTEAPGMLVPSSRTGSRCLALLADWLALTGEERQARAEGFRRELEWSVRIKDRDLRAQVQKREISAEEARTLLSRHEEATQEELELFRRLGAELIDAEMQWRRRAGQGAPPRTPQSFRCLPSATASMATEIDLAAICGLVLERDLVHLLTADALWAELPHTNRDFWRDRIAVWAKEIVEQGPRLVPEANGPDSGKADPDQRPDDLIVSPTARLVRVAIKQSPLGGARPSDRDVVATWLATWSQFPPRPDPRKPDG